MNKDFKLNLLWDIDLSSGNIELVDKVDYTIQSLRQRLNFFLGEFFLDNTLGFPIYQQLLVKNPNINIIRIKLLELITSEDYIKELTELIIQVDSTSRILIVSFKAICMSDEEIEQTFNLSIG